MLKLRILLLTMTAACGSPSSGGAGGMAGTHGLGGMGGAVAIVCPEVAPGQDEILQPEDRQRMIELCGSDCFPFFGQVRRDSDGCVEPSVDGGLSATCLPIWSGDCTAVDLRLELVDCASNEFLEQDIVIVGGVTECRVNVDDGTVVLTGNTFWPLDEEQWRLCSEAEQRSVLCLEAADSRPRARFNSCIRMH